MAYEVSCETARECALLELLNVSQQRAPVPIYNMPGDDENEGSSMMGAGTGSNPPLSSSMSILASRLLPRGDFSPDSDSYADDATWVLMASFVILTMQSGFGLLEMGYSSHGNEVNIMMKNVMDVVFGALAFWLLGYGLAFGEPSIPFMGLGHFAPDVSGGLDPANDGGLLYSSYLFQFSFAATATTIVSGAAAMRIRFNVYCLFSFASVVIYGFVAHWVWAEDGWLFTRGYHDFAGGAPVHLLGGMNSLVAIAMIGPRTGRFDGTRPPSAFAPVSPTSVLFGLFILWWGWVGFICGSTFGITGTKWVVASRAAVVTINATSGGGIAAFLLSLAQTRGRHVLPTNAITGILGALVATTPSADVVHFFEALIIGALGAVFAIWTNAVVRNRLKLDDPVGAVGVHAGAGIWGILAVGLFADGTLVGVDVRTGLFRGGGWDLLGMQLAGIAATCGWGALCSSAFFYTVGVFNSRSPSDPRSGLRVSRRDELRGADKCEHGITEGDSDGAAAERAKRARLRRKDRDGSDGRDNGNHGKSDAADATTSSDDDPGDSSQPEFGVEQFRSSGRPSLAGGCLAVDLGEDFSEGEEDGSNEDDEEAPASHRPRRPLILGVTSFGLSRSGSSLSSVFTSVRRRNIFRSTHSNMGSGALHSEFSAPGQRDEEKDGSDAETQHATVESTLLSTRKVRFASDTAPKPLGTISEKPEQESFSSESDR